MTNISVTLKVVVDCSERRRKSSAPAVTRRKDIRRMTVRPIIFPAGKGCRSGTLQRA